MSAHTYVVMHKDTVIKRGLPTLTAAMTFAQAHARANTEIVWKLTAAGRWAARVLPREGYVVREVRPQRGSEAAAPAPSGRDR